MTQNEFNKIPENERNAIAMIYNEYLSAKRRYPKPFNSAHEAYAVILEELDETWDFIKKHPKPRADKRPPATREQMKTEIQAVGAMVLRFIIEL